MVTGKPGPLDEMVGANIRLFRTDRGMSQALLAEKIGVSFQQMQKDEEGANRIGACRLSNIAAVLGISVRDLFESGDDRIAGRNSPVRMLDEPGTLRVLRTCVRTSSPRARLSSRVRIRGSFTRG